MTIPVTEKEHHAAIAGFTRTHGAEHAHTKAALRFVEAIEAL